MVGLFGARHVIEPDAGRGQRAGPRRRGEHGTGVAGTDHGPGKTSCHDRSHHRCQVRRMQAVPLGARELPATYAEFPSEPD